MTAMIWIVALALLFLVNGESIDVALPDDSTDHMEIKKTSESSPGNLTDSVTDSSSRNSFGVPLISSQTQSQDGQPLGTTSSTVSRSLQTSFGQLHTWRSLLLGKGQNWTKNYPSRRDRYHISTYKRSIEDKSSKLLLVGGINSDTTAVNDTWSYTPWSNSWLEFATTQLPPTYAWGYPILPTVCEAFVLLVNSDSDIWLFDGRYETWSHVPVYDWSLDYFPVEGTVSLRQSVCSTPKCTCSESVFAYGRTPIDPSSWYLRLCELKCEGDQDGQVRCYLANRHPFECNKFVLEPSDQSSCTKEDDMPHGIMAAADHDLGIIYFLLRCLPGGIYATLHTTLYKYDVQRRTVHHFHLAHEHQWLCFQNVFVWNTSHLILFDAYKAVVVSLKNNSNHKLWDLGIVSSDFDPYDIFLIMQSLEPVRIHWIDSLPHIYRLELHSTEHLPHFVQSMMPFPPQLSPGSLQNYTSVYDYDSQTFYVYGGVQYHHRRQLMNSSARKLWTLTMPYNTWWLIEPHTTPTAYISNCGTYGNLNVIIFGGQYDDGRVGSELWIYKTELRTWKKIVSASDAWPGSRAGCSLTASLNGTTSVLFGGYSTAGIAKSDVWLLHLNNNGTAMWQSITPSPDTSTERSPFARFGHSTAVVGHEVIIYGGKSNLLEGSGCFRLSDMWAFNISNRGWRELLALPAYDLLKTCTFTSSEVGDLRNSFLITYGQSKIIVWENTSNKKSVDVSNSRSVWMIDTISKNRTTNILPPVSAVVQAAGVWNGSLVYYGQYITKKGTWKDALLALGQRCFPGSAELSGPAGPCVPCPSGQYSVNHLTVNECVKCPQGTTTNGSGIASFRHCACDINYCNHGICEIPRAENDAIIAVCRCSFGFIGERCDQISYVVFVLSFGILVTAFPVVIALSCCGIRTVRHRRARRRTEWELKETRLAFTIMPQEIELLCRLDEDCPGGYGEVHKATYREWTVAVKQLQVVMAEWVDIRREFLREIQFMRTVRHPNIVMFIAAGHYDENQPFLVLEFMSGGALRSLLQNTDVQLTTNDQLKFMLDTAEGMKYLHTLQPPRIHRDLKSANLLLSTKRQVKVADFGSARLISKLKQPTTERRSIEMSSTDESEQLLNESMHLTSHHVGTPRWRSPEMWRRKSYGTATDVYSFAIVLWEIVTRQTPFSGPAYKFTAQVEDAVLSGTRPPIPDGISQDLSSLMTKSWQENPEDRQNFTDIVSQLQCIIYRQRQPEDLVDIETSQSLPTEAVVQLHEPSCPDAGSSGSVQAKQHELVTLHHP